jgi:cob(I)alamin adenosyltransferase
MKSIRGLIQVYTGPGKGKTTAALGLMMRTLGHGRQVILIRLLKPTDRPCGELQFLADHPRVRVIDAGVGILKGDAPAAVVRRSIFDALGKAQRLWQEQPADLLVIDEVNNALHHKLLNLEELWDYLVQRPTGMEVVLTGRNAPEALLERADLVTVMACHRHPMQYGVPARKGVEY